MTAIGRKETSKIVNLHLQAIGVISTEANLEQGLLIKLIHFIISFYALPNLSSLRSIPDD